jgi:xanthine dehydrogenase FAD-binding subunit
MIEFQKYAAPRSLSEAAALLAAGQATILAGGTDLMPQARSGKLKVGALLVNIQHVAELRGISEHAGALRIGSLTHITELLDSAIVRSRIPILWEACNHFASDQIRNAATLGGNVCNASPAGDTLVPLLVLGAKVRLASHVAGTMQERVVPIGEFIVGPGRTKRTPNELVSAVEVPLPETGWVDAFFKFGTRPALDISTIAIGLGGVWRDGSLHDVRVAFGAVAPTPIRSPAAEKVLEGRPLDEDTIALAAQAADSDIRPISDVRASDWYRHELVRNLLKRMLHNVRQS